MIDLFLLKACTNDDDCDHMRCFYCTSNNTCVRWNINYCNNKECGLGDGDCDISQCKENLRCGESNFLQFHPKLSSCVSLAHDYDACIQAGKMQFWYDEIFLFYNLNLCWLLILHIIQLQNFIFQATSTYSLIARDGVCHHVDGGLPSNCRHESISSVSLCEEYCTNQTSCVGYTCGKGYNPRGLYCYLFPSDSTCPIGFGFRPTSTTAKRMGDLIAKISGKMPGYVCYGKHSGKYNGCNESRSRFVSNSFRLYNF